MSTCCPCSLLLFTFPEGLFDQTTNDVSQKNRHLGTPCPFFYPGKSKIKIARNIKYVCQAMKIFRNGQKCVEFERERVEKCFESADARILIFPLIVKEEHGGTDIRW